jgi:hypothetical protein
MTHRRGLFALILTAFAGQNFVPAANANKPTLLLHFTSGLTNLGGSVNLVNSTDGVCGGSSCSGLSNGGILNGRVTGTPVTSSVLEPATLVLCSAGLVGVGVRRWRQRRL